MNRETFVEGTVFSCRYRVDSYIGGGSMGEVYLGHDEVLEIPVAIKVMRPSLAASPLMKERFRNEALRTAKLRHANIVLIYVVDEEDGHPYIVMQHLEGEPLDEFIRRRGPVSTAEISTIVGQIAAALDEAHAHGVIHRDVKPSNVMRGPSGSITLMDFGLAHNVQGTRFTRAGVAMGTPQYMSPEQIKTPQEIDNRTDVYALGHIAYELLTGQPAIDEDLSEFDIFHTQINEDLPPPSEVSGSSSPAVDAVVLRALAKDPGDRFDTAGEFAASLEEAAAKRSTATRISPWAVVPLLATMLLVGWALNRRGAGAGDGLDEARSSAVQTTQSTVARSIMFLPDDFVVDEGECTHIAWEAAGAASVYIDGQTVQASGQREVCPEGAAVYEIRVVYHDGTEETKVIEIEQDEGLSSSASESSATRTSTGRASRVGAPAHAGTADVANELPTSVPTSGLEDEVITATPVPTAPPPTAVPPTAVRPTEVRATPRVATTVPTAEPTREPAPTRRVVTSPPPTSIPTAPPRASATRPPAPTRAPATDAPTSSRPTSVPTDPYP